MPPQQHLQSLQLVQGYRPVHDGVCDALRERGCGARSLLEGRHVLQSRTGPFILSGGYLVRQN
jgi:hypothetical protein